MAQDSLSLRAFGTCNIAKMYILHSSIIFGKTAQPPYNGTNDMQSDVVFKSRIQRQLEQKIHLPNT